MANIHYFSLQYIEGGYIFSSSLPDKKKSIVKDTDIKTFLGERIVDFLGGSNGMRKADGVSVRLSVFTNAATAEASAAPPATLGAEAMKDIVPIMERNDFYTAIREKSLRGYTKDGYIMFFGETAKLVAGVLGVTTRVVATENPTPGGNGRSVEHHYLLLAATDPNCRYLGLLNLVIQPVKGDWNAVAESVGSYDRRLSESVAALRERHAAAKRREEDEQNKKK